MTKIAIKRGSIGPRHDPYGWETVAVTRHEETTTFYSDGLGRTKLNGEEDPHAELHFAERTGMTVEQAIAYRMEYESRCPMCGGKRFTEVSGYPGETLHVCVRCDKIAHTLQDWEYVT